MSRQNNSQTREAATADASGTSESLDASLFSTNTIASGNIDDVGNDVGSNNDVLSGNRTDVDNVTGSRNDIASNNTADSGNVIASGNDVLSSNEANVDNVRESGNTVGSQNTVGSNNTAGSGNTVAYTSDVLSANEVLSGNQVGSGNAINSGNSESFRLDLAATENDTRAVTDVGAVRDMIEADDDAMVDVGDIAIAVNALAGAGNDLRSVAQNANNADDSDEIADVSMDFGAPSAGGDRDGGDRDHDRRGDEGEDAAATGFEQAVTARAEAARVGDGMDDGQSITDITGDVSLAMTNGASAAATAAAEGAAQQVSAGDNTQLNEAAGAVVGGDETVSLSETRSVSGLRTSDGTVAEETTASVGSDNEIASDNVTDSGNDVLSGNAVGSDNVRNGGNTTLSGNDLLSGNVTDSANVIGSGNDFGSDNTADARNTVASGNEVLSGNEVQSGNTVASGNDVAVDTDFGSENLIGSNNALLSGNQAGSNNVATTEIGVDLSRDSAETITTEVAAEDLIEADDDAHVLIDDIAIDYGSLSGDGNDMAFDLDQANQLVDSDQVSDVSLAFSGSFEQTVLATAGEAIAGDGLDGFGGHGHATMLSDIIGDVSVDVANIANANATAVAEGISQSVSTGGNVMLNSFDLSVTGGDSSFSQIADDFVA